MCHDIVWKRKIGARGVRQSKKIALQAQTILAEGNALGDIVNKICALKGRAKK